MHLVMHEAFSGSKISAVRIYRLGIESNVQRNEIAHTKKVSSHILIAIHAYLTQSQ